MTTPEQPDTPALTRKQIREIRNTGSNPVISGTGRRRPRQRARTRAGRAPSPARPRAPVPAPLARAGHGRAVPTPAEPVAVATGARARRRGRPRRLAAHPPPGASAGAHPHRLGARHHPRSRRGACGGDVRNGPRVRIPRRARAGRAVPRDREPAGHRASERLRGDDRQRHARPVRPAARVRGRGSRAGADWQQPAAAAPVAVPAFSAAPQAPELRMRTRTSRSRMSSAQPRPPTKRPSTSPRAKAVNPLLGASLLDERARCTGADRCRVPALVRPAAVTDDRIHRHPEHLDRLAGARSRADGGARHRDRRGARSPAPSICPRASARPATPRARRTARRSTPRSSTASCRRTRRRRRSPPAPPSARSRTRARSSSHPRPRRAASS